MRIATGEIEESVEPDDGKARQARTLQDAGHPEQSITNAPQGTTIGVTARPKGGIAAAALGIVQHSHPEFGRPGQTVPRSWPSTELRIAVMIARPARRRCMAHLLVVPRLAAATPDPREPPVPAVPPAGGAFLLLAGVGTIGGAVSAVFSVHLLTLFAVPQPR